MTDSQSIRSLDEDLVELLAPAFAQATNSLSTGAVDAVIAKIRAAPNRGQFDVRGSMALPDSIAKFDTLTFSDQAVLVLEALDSPFIAIAARRLVLDIKNPQYKAYLSRPSGKAEDAIVSSLRGGDGNPGTRGSPGQGDVNRQGMSGHAGGDGESGWGGSTKEIPPVFIFVQDIEFGVLGEIGQQFMFLFFQGITGGAGGIGGKGGPGGDGGAGKAGASSIIDCMEGPGRGGDGGSAGRGGAGGCGGTGGRGGVCISLVPKKACLPSQRQT